jgi:hypothetical protein
MEAIMKDEVCCPEFDPAPWDGKTHTWNDKPFLVATVPQIFHMPIPGIYGKTIGKLWDTAKAHGVDYPDPKDFLLLAYDPSPWKSELYLAVTEEKQGMNTIRMNGEFLSKVFDGPYSAVPTYIAEFEEFARNRHKTLGRYYFYYTTCPKCAKKYGHNYIVAFGEVIG